MNKYLMYGIEDYAESRISREYAQSDITDALTLLDRAATQLAERQVPPFAQGVIAMLALSIMGIIATSPDDEAERLAAIAAIARRQK